MTAAVDNYDSAPMPSAPTVDVVKRDFIAKVFSRYMTMMISLAIGAYFASFIPVGILLSGSYLLASGLVYLAVLITYGFTSLRGEYGSHDSFGEFAVGLSTGLMLAASFVSFELLLPGQLVVAIFVTFSILMAFVSYVAMSVLTRDVKFLQSVNNYVAGFSKFVLSALIFSIFLYGFSIASGIYIFSFGMEMTLLVMFSMTLLANIYNVIENQSVISSSGEMINCGNNPSLAALYLFFDTLNLLLELMEIMILIKRSKEDKGQPVDWSLVVGKIFVVGASLGMGFWLVRTMLSNKFRAEQVYQAAMPPEYSEVVGGDNPPPAYEEGHDNRP